MKKNKFIKLFIGLTIAIGILSPMAQAEAYGTVGGLTKASLYGSSKLINAMLAMNGQHIRTYPSKALPDAYRDESQEGNINRAKARAYAILLIKENKNNCVKDVYAECALAYNPLIIAIESGDIELTKLLIEMGCHINDESIDDYSYMKKFILNSKDPKVHQAYKLAYKAKRNKKPNK